MAALALRTCLEHALVETSGEACVANECVPNKQACIRCDARTNARFLERCCLAFYAPSNYGKNFVSLVLGVLETKDDGATVDAADVSVFQENCKQTLREHFSPRCPQYATTMRLLEAYVLTDNQ